MIPPSDRTGEPLQRLDETLRLVATMPAPEGLTDRVKENLRSASRRAGVIAWPRAATPAGWMHSSTFRGAAAAAIVCMVAGGGWQIYSHVQPAATAHVFPAPAQTGNSGAFSNAEARRRPDTLDKPVVPPSAVQTPRPSEVVTAKPTGSATTNGKAANAKKKRAEVQH